MTWTLGRKLGAAFGAVSVLFLIALAVSLSFAGKANDRWDETLALTKAEQGASQQIRGIQAQMRAQAQLAATLDSDYEAAFEAMLRARGIPYVPIDEAKRALFSSAKLKSFDFVVYSKTGPNLLVDVKGRQLRDRSKALGAALLLRQEIAKAR